MKTTYRKKGLPKRLCRIPGGVEGLVSACAVLLKEIVNPADDPKGRGEHGFSCERFREITPEELENTQAIAEEMLLPA